LVRKVGANELAVAFVAVGKRALAELLGRLPPEHAEELISAVKRVTAADQVEFQEAQAFLSRVMGNFHNTDELFQKAGLYRLARSIAMEESVFVRQLSQRFPRAHGRLLTDYLTRVRQQEPESPDRILRLRDQVLEEVADLARRGKIDGRYAQSPIAYKSR
jgi:hypothetical protein